MRPAKILVALSFLSAVAIALPNGAEARRLGGGGFHGGGARVAHFHGGVRPGWHGGGTRWAGGHYRHGGGYYYRGGGYYGRGWSWPAAAAGVATGAALGAAAAYGSSSCYRTQNVWNGYSYVPQTVNVC
jgi:hypothetical protein